MRSGACSPDEAVHRLRRLPFADLGFAKVDHHRSLRQGLPEAVYGQGKTPEQCQPIVGELLGRHDSGRPPHPTSIPARAAPATVDPSPADPTRVDPTWVRRSS